MKVAELGRIPDQIARIVLDFNGNVARARGLFSARQQIGSDLPNVATQSNTACPQFA
ncbi:hypothetical protein PGA1_c08730 [Phaeobacter inhibens DSM 17395]|nr:hypothetical protein PGA1_c08730 [Phaeobacter inhibens DSM 17395]